MRSKARQSHVRGKAALTTWDSCGERERRPRKRSGFSAPPERDLRAVAKLHQENIGGLACPERAS
jgi:hypothetical protein